MSGYDHRTLGIVYEFGSLCHSFIADVWVGYVTADEVAFLIMPFHCAHLCVFGDVEHHWTRTPGRRDVEGACYGFGDVLGTAHLAAPFCHRLGDANHVGFLEGVGAQTAVAYLSGDYDKRSAVDEGVGDACDYVGCAGDVTIATPVRPVTRA